MARQQPPQPRHHLGVPPAHQAGLGIQFLRPGPRLLQPVRLRGHQRRARYIGQRPPVPQPQRLAEQLRRPFRRIAAQRTAAIGDQRGEPVRVQLPGAEHELIAGRPGDQHLALGIPDQLAQVVDVDADKVRSLRRWPVRPEFLNCQQFTFLGIGDRPEHFYP